jgi:transposase
MVQEATPGTVAIPDDLSACQRMLRETLQALTQRDRELDGLRHRLDQLLRRLYGPRAERFDPNQPTLFDPCPPLPELPPSCGPDESEPPAARRKKKGHGRRALPKDLPRRREEHDLTEAEKLCPCCAQPRVKLGEQTSEQLDYIPASLRVVEHARPTYACLECLKKSERGEPLPAHSTLESWLPMTESEKEARRAKLIVTAPMPKQPIAKGLAGPGLLAHIITSKYADHLPLYRLEGMFARQGVDISRKTMSDWLAECAALLTPLYELMKRRVLQSRVIHSDDTTVPVQQPGQGKTKTGRLWVSLGDAAHSYTVFDYTPDHCRDGPRTFFQGYKGYLQVDAYSGYECLFTSGDIVEVACWAHTRRKFYDAQTSDAVRSFWMLGMIRGLYEGEEEVAQLDEEAAKVAYRRQHAKPLLATIEQWLLEHKDQVLPKSPLAEAIGYALNNWTALNRYVDGGYLSIDNNAAERALRAVAIGRKNWLFAGSDKGGRTAAILYSMVGTCKRLGIDPWAYLRDALTRLPELPADRLPDLLSDAWAHAQREHVANP